MKHLLFLCTFLTSFFCHAQENNVILKDTIGEFVFDALVTEMGTVPQENINWVKYFKYIGADSVVITKAKTSDPHVFKSYPRDQILQKDSIYSFGLTFPFESYSRGGYFNKSAVFEFSNGQRVNLRFKAFVDTNYVKEDKERDFTICKGKNLLVPKGYIQKGYIQKENYVIPECKDVEVILETYDFLFTGFEKYGYTLHIDTTDIDNLIASSSIIGYFDLVSNIDSITEIFFSHWVLDNMGFNIVENENTIKQGETKKVKFTILKRTFQIAKKDFASPLIPIIKEDSIRNKKNYIDNLNLMERLKNSNAHFRIFNRFTIFYNGSSDIVNVIFMLPVKYIRDITF